VLPKEIFLSHSDRDRQFVKKLVAMMRRHGLPVWYSRTNILFVLVLSPSAVESMWVKRELMFSLQQNRFENKIVPLLYQPCDYDQLSWTLSSFQMIDFTQTFEQGCRDLLLLWGLGYQA